MCRIFIDLSSNLTWPLRQPADARLEQTQANHVCAFTKCYSARVITRAASGRSTALRQRGGKFDTCLSPVHDKSLIRHDPFSGIQVAKVFGEGSGRKPRVFDPPPLVATFGRSNPVPVFFGRRPED
jgi:hypothetical protein